MNVSLISMIITNLMRIEAVEHYFRLWTYLCDGVVWNVRLCVRHSTWHSPIHVIMNNIVENLSIYYINFSSITHFVWAHIFVIYLLDLISLSKMAFQRKSISWMLTWRKASRIAKWIQANLMRINQNQKVFASVYECQCK